MSAAQENPTPASICKDVASKYMAANPTDELASELDAIRSRNRPFTTKCAEIEALVGPSIFEAIETYFAVPKARLKSSETTLYANRARLACYWLMAYAGLTKREIGAIMRKRTSSTIFRGLDQVDVLLQTDPAFAAALNRAKQELC
jgi:hypothetical protein